MRIAAAVLGVFGALAGGFLGAKWFGDLQSEEVQAAEALAEAAGASGAAAELAGMKSATYALLGCALVGLVASLMVARLKGNKLANAVLLIVAGALPIALSSKAVFGAPMVLAGLLAFAVKYPDAGTPPKA